MNYLDLFSGIGGFALGLYRAGWRFNEHLFSEIEPYAVALYQKRFPESVSVGDICKIDGAYLRERYSGDWFITGGFPCQDISVAGKGAGITGLRSGLWFEMRRLIGELRPRHIIIENVGAISVRGLDSVLSSLAETGYDAEWQCIRAEDVGAPHKRERLWIVAYPNDNGQQPKNDRQRRVIQNFNRECPSSEQQQDNFQSWVGENSGNATDANGINGERFVASSSYQDGRTFTSERPFRPQNSINEPPDTESAKWECAGTAWTRRSRLTDYYWRDHWMEVAARTCRVDDGLSRRLDKYRRKRLRGLGNAVVPQIPEILGKLIGNYNE